MSERGPDFLAIDHEVVSLELGAGLQRGEIRTGARFRHPLAPDFIAGENRLKVALFLLVGAPLHQGRPGHDNPERVASHRKAEPAKLLLEDDLLDEGGAAAAVFLGPRQTGPSRFIQTLVPFLETLPLRRSE